VLVGELGLDGSLRPVKGALPIAILARKLEYEFLVVPSENAREAAVVDRLKVYGASTLRDVVSILSGEPTFQPLDVDTRAEFAAAQCNYPMDFADVKGQLFAKRACEIAAAGGHNILLIGSPGCGKSMMAKRIPSILPHLTLAESLETTQIHSVAGKLGANATLIAQRPFRAPHHTISDVALIGGGTNFQPGEISLAHNGVLFLDELPEFSRTALETLRQPLEDRKITISRAKYTATLPCSFMLVGSMNPCPCGYYGHPSHKCACSPGQIHRYMNRISGPLLDRFDLHVPVQPVSLEELAVAPRGETSAEIRERVVKARALQTERFAGEAGVHCNAQMPTRLLERFARPDTAAADRLSAAMKRLNLSARAYERILKVARTIADLEASPDIKMNHIAEAVNYRNLDRSTWGE
jgi:magnesium chelatase family protein